MMGGIAERTSGRLVSELCRDLTGVIGEGPTRGDGRVDAAARAHDGEGLVQLGASRSGGRAGPVARPPPTLGGERPDHRQRVHALDEVVARRACPARPRWR